PHAAAAPPGAEGRVDTCGGCRDAAARLAAPRSLPRLHGLGPRRLPPHRSLRGAGDQRGEGAGAHHGPGARRGRGSVAPGVRMFEADAIVVATGAEPIIPPIPGLEEAGYWTNREATATEEIPDSVVFIGGGVVAADLSQFLGRFGSRVTIIGPELAGREDPQVAELLTGILEAEGVQLLLGR